MNRDQLSEAHLRMLREIEEGARGTESWTGRRGFSEAVMAAMARVRRHLFVPVEQQAMAYVNHPLPIGFGQTISQPYMVACMTDLLEVDRKSRVLEIGTGCGYQTAVLAEVAGRVFSVEIVPELAESAKERLIRLGYDNIRVREGDGWQGWPEKAPFDAIMVTAAPECIPDALVEQLETGGRLVVPVGARYSTQMLLVCIKRPDGSLEERRSLPVAFVPMVHGGGHYSEARR